VLLAYASDPTFTSVWTEPADHAPRCVLSRSTCSNSTIFEGLWTESPDHLELQAPNDEFRLELQAPNDEGSDYTEEGSPCLAPTADVVMRLSLADGCEGGPQWSLYESTAEEGICTLREPPAEYSDCYLHVNGCPVKCVCVPSSDLGRTFLRNGTTASESFIAKTFGAQVRFGCVRSFHPSAVASSRLDLSVSAFIQRSRASAPAATWQHQPSLASRSLLQYLQAAFSSG
jgi:hypothetical protein